MSVLVVGDGPGGLSAALFLAKKDMPVTVVGRDETPMHYAMLYNYLGIPEMTGSEFQEVSRKQVASFGATLLDARAKHIKKTAAGFQVTLDNKETLDAKYVILAEGKSMKLANSLSLALGIGGIEVDREGRTAIEGLYVIGRSTKLRRSQAIISAGEGASAALDILSAEAGKDVLDYDSVG